jgi:hypothetical protein
MARLGFSQTCCTSPAAMCYWAAAFAVLYGLGLLRTEPSASRT